MAIAREYIRCGKPNCRTCPHGPYYYQYWRDGKRIQKKYLGRVIPPTADLRSEDRGLDWWHCQHCGYSQPYLAALKEECPVCRGRKWGLKEPKLTGQKASKRV